MISFELFEPGNVHQGLSTITGSHTHLGMCPTGACRGAHHRKFLTWSRAKLRSTLTGYRLAVYRLSTTSYTNMMSSLHAVSRLSISWWKAITCKGGKADRAARTPFGHLFDGFGGEKGATNPRCS